MEVLKIGDVVVLLSGGPKMTVESIDGFSGQNDETKKPVKCVWHDGESYKRDVFVYLNLERINAELDKKHPYEVLE
jgi:uncharacterized protein YodC (DUF2158 family)